MAVVFLNLGTQTVLDIQGASWVNGQPVITHSSHGGANQKWDFYFTPDQHGNRSADIGFAIRSIHPDAHDPAAAKVLDLHPDNRLFIHDNHKSINESHQVWTFDNNPIVDNVRIISRKNHLALTVDAPDTQVYAKPLEHENPFQLWQVYCVSDQPWWRDLISGTREFVERVIKRKTEAQLQAKDLLRKGQTLPRGNSGIRFASICRDLEMWEPGE